MYFLPVEALLGISYQNNYYHITKNAGLHFNSSVFEALGKPEKLASGVSAYVCMKYVLKVCREYNIPSTHTPVHFLYIPVTVTSDIAFDFSYGIS